MERRPEDNLPDDIDALKAALVAARSHAAQVETELAAATTPVAAVVRKRPARKPFPEYLPGERVVLPEEVAA